MCLFLKCFLLFPFLSSGIFVRQNQIYFMCLSLMFKNIIHFSVSISPPSPLKIHFSQNFSVVQVWKPVNNKLMAPSRQTSITAQLALTVSDDTQNAAALDWGTGAWELNYEASAGRVQCMFFSSIRCRGLPHLINFFTVVSVVKGCYKVIAVSVVIF